MSTPHTLQPDDVMEEGGDVVRRAQEACWYAETSMGKAVLRYREVHDLLRDARFRNMGTDVLTRQGVTDGLVRRMYEGFLLSTEGAAHARLRGLLKKGFTPDAVDALRPRMRERMHALLDEIGDRTEFDFVTAVAERFPGQVIIELLGLPVSFEDPDFRRWCSDLGYIVGLEVKKHLPRLEAAFEGLRGYIEPTIAARRAEPRGDLISTLAAAEQNGDRFSEEELVCQIVALLFGGLDTTRRTIGKAFLVMLEHPDQRRLLQERPDLAEPAAEEILRYAPGTRVAIRVATCDLELDGVPIRAGELVIAATGAANRDPRVFEAPETFDITRRGAAPLSLGAGPHHCLGAYLARAELQEAVPILTRRLTEAALASPVVVRTAREGSPGPRVIPLRCRVRPR
ncbi:cytochrome P450 [Sorangium sp. So ce128]|uniref:cytochrome P450 n=1 Tax=Sorangium sp. So ce128 TaxID=3133281 RepID=UPI003F617814